MMGETRLGAVFQTAGFQKKRSTLSVLPECGESPGTSTCSGLFIAFFVPKVVSRKQAGIGSQRPCPRRVEPDMPFARGHIYVPVNQQEITENRIEVGAVPQARHRQSKRIAPGLSAAQEPPGARRRTLAHYSQWRFDSSRRRTPWCSRHVPGLESQQEGTTPLVTSTLYLVASAPRDLARA